MAFIHKSGKSAVRLVLNNRISPFQCRSLSQSSDVRASMVGPCSPHVHISLSASSTHLNCSHNQPNRWLNTSTIFYRPEDDDQNDYQEEEKKRKYYEKRKFLSVKRPANDLDGNVRLPVKYHRVLDIPVEESIRYMQSEAYKNTYGDEPVWKKYRRNNYPGHYFSLPRKACIQGSVLNTGSACPICRDDYLVVDYRNVELLKQFISPVTGEQYFMKITCVCQRAQQYLDVAIARAKDTGLLVHDVPIRHYDNEDFYSPELLKSNYRFVEK
ncbi:Ribosomal protein S18 [Trinorchestia longiramus]|nr:Ribosomal protein S18 [Trinorchestia longiramus]